MMLQEVIASFLCFHSASLRQAGKSDQAWPRAASRAIADFDLGTHMALAAGATTRSG